MTLSSNIAIALGALSLLLGVWVLLLARSRRQHARRGRDLSAEARAANSRAEAADARALAEEVKRKTAESSMQEVATRETELLDELRHLGSARLPALGLNTISSHHPVPGLLHKSLAGSEGAQLLDAIPEVVSGIIRKERHRTDAAARAALRGATQESQALSYRLQTYFMDLQHEFSAPLRLTQSLFESDHLNEQNLRLLQKAAIVCGGWPGHVRKDTRVAEVVGGASSRLRGFNRINVASRLGSNIGVVGRAAEPVAVVCAELMANALEHSRDDLMVEVSLIHTGSGSVCITIDDAGKGMEPEDLARGRRLMSGEEGEVMLTEIGDPPSMGFPAIGRLVADYGLHVSLESPSPYGGVRAVVSVPENLLTSIDENVTPQSVMAPQPAVAPQVHTRPAPADSPPHTPAPDSAAALPQRRRRFTAKTVNNDADGAPKALRLDPEQTGAMWSDIESGLASGQSITDSE
ncbi:sensor histidine kinase (plasmid) [Streptomyces sp. NBC_01724]|uniref:ATP-binding protein n=1 Tax=Streptomyces sp. NBC_01724 TaxID=2975922 RepID=UPI002E35BAEF|nr:ATP-binding protein [Streptomyces sp. NBC_01724]